MGFRPQKDGPEEIRVVEAGADQVGAGEVAPASGADDRELGRMRNFRWWF